jgi:hypothetical protein
MNTNFNWQLTSKKAQIFLEDICPYLRLKKKEAELAIRWQKGRPEPSRDPVTGWYVRYVDDKKDVAVDRQLRRMKKTRRLRFKKGKS